MASDASQGVRGRDVFTKVSFSACGERASGQYCSGVVRLATPIRYGGELVMESHLSKRLGKYDFRHVDVYDFFESATSAGLQ